MKSPHPGLSALLWEVRGLDDLEGLTQPGGTESLTIINPVF